MQDVVAFLRDHVLTLPNIAKFALAMIIFAGVPKISRLLRIPDAVGLLLTGVLIGPYVLGVFGAQRPIAEGVADLGKLLLMFFAGLDIDLALFRRAQRRSTIFGLTTTTLPLLLGAGVGLLLGYNVLAAIVIGSLLASHTLLALAAVKDRGLGGREPVIVTVGATVMSDTLSLVVFAVCLSTFTTGFSLGGMALLIGEIVAYILLVLFGLSRVAAWVLKKFENEEEGYFIVMLAVMAISGMAAEAIQLPGIVGAFLAGLAVNASARDKSAAIKLEFIAKTLFIPAFFVVTGFLIDPRTFVSGIRDHFPLVAGLIGALLVGKWIAAQGVGRAFGYSPTERGLVWSLTLPQVAATLAATLAAYHTYNHAGQRLIDEGLLNAVLVLMLTTAILGPVLSERYASRLQTEGGAQPDGTPAGGQDAPASPPPA